MRQSTALAFVLLTVVACDRQTPSAADDTAPGGTLIVGLQTDVQSVIPPAIRQVEQRIVADQIFEPLARMGDEGSLDAGFRPALADSWTWERDSTAIAFKLNPAARWHDGVPVRATDVRFTFALYTDADVGSLEREALEHIDSVTVRDSTTAVFWFDARYPDQLYDAAARMLIVPEHALANAPRATLDTVAFGRAPIGSGRFRVAKWDSKTAIELVADTLNYHGRPKLDRVLFAVSGDPGVLLTRMMSGEVDAAEVVSADHFRTLSARPEFTTRTLPAFDYAYLQFNMHDPRRPGRPHPLFMDAALRRALTMGLDRARLVQSQFDTLASVALGPMTRAQPLADTTVQSIPYDSAGAARLLDSLGWKLPPGKAVRERAGQPLAFSAIVPSVSKGRMAMAVRVQEALRGLGVELRIDALETGTFMSRLGKRNFDAAFSGTHADVSVSGVRAYWSATGPDGSGSMNFSSYSNAVFDAHLDSALTAHGMDQARAHARQAFAAIVSDAPAVWLYELRSAPVIHKRFRTAHVNAGGWWVGIADWSVPPNERIDRDRIGLRVAAR